MANNIKPLTKKELTELVIKLQKEIEDLKWEIIYIKTNIKNLKIYENISRIKKNN